MIVVIAKDIVQDLKGKSMKTNLKKKYTLIAVMVSMAMIFSMMPCVGFAANNMEPNGSIPKIESSVKVEKISSNVKLDSKDALLEQYLENEAIGDVPKRGSRGNKLGDANKAIYDYVLKEIKKIASGSETSTEITIPASVFMKDTVVTAEDIGLPGFFKTDGNGKIVVDNNNQVQWADGVMDNLNEAILKKYQVDLNKVISALRYDVPYELYWFDKTRVSEIQTYFSNIEVCYTENGDLRNDQVIVKNSDGYIALSLKVSMDYCHKYNIKYDGNGNIISYSYKDTQTDRAKTGAVGTTVSNARKVVEEAAAYSDLDKMKAYKNKICEDVSYDYDVADDNYGDPWQIVNVFDGDTNTNVVCEGYSKAFKYLCEITEFKDDHVECHLMTGNMTGGTGAGDHMWNVVHMDDGKNYLVDVTNCDGNLIGSPDKLFLVTDKKSNPNEYSFNLSPTISYKYDDETKAMFTDAERTLSDHDYADHNHELVRKEAVEAVSCETDGNIACWICKHCGALFSDEAGEHGLTEEEIKVKVAHKLNKTERNSATCTEAGNIAYWTCTECKKLFSDVDGKNEITKEATVIKAGHKLKKTKEKAATCTEAGHTAYWTCTECGKLFGDEAGEKVIEHAGTVIDAKGHRWDTGTVTREATATLEGVKTFKCRDCPATRTETIDKLSVNENGVPQKDCIDSTTPTDAAADTAAKISAIKTIPAAGLSTVGNVKKKTMSISWKKVNGTLNYRVAYRKAGATNWTYAWTQGQTKYIIKKLKANQMFEFKVAAYGVANNKWVYGGWSEVSYRYMAATTVKLKAGKKSFKATIKKVKKSSGYDVIYALNKAQTKSKKVKSLKGATKTKFVVKKLKKGKKYFVTVRPYKKYKGKKYIGVLSKVYKVKVK